MGFFSWVTEDTKRSISNRYSDRGTFTVYMVDPVSGKTYQENNYEGYGVFGGKDFYELLAEINGLKPDRYDGIELSFSGKDYISPYFVEDPSLAEKYKGALPVTCDYQGFFYEDETEEDEEDETYFDDDEYEEDEEDEEDEY